MRVLLVDPPGMFLAGRGLTRQVEPLGLAYVGAVLAPEHDVRILLPDTRAYAGDAPWGEIRTAIAREAPDVVGITAVTAALPAVARLVDLVKSLDPTITVITGGPHPTADPAGALEVTGADVAVIGEGEGTAVELLRALGGGRRPLPDLGAIAGLAWRSPDGGVRRTATRPANRQLGLLPWPMRTNLVWPEEVEPSFYGAVISARGCTSCCIYCAAGLMGRGIRERPVDDVAGEISHLRQAHGIDHFFFHDSVFTANRSRTAQLCGALARDARVTWDCQTRADCLDPGLLATMAAGGCRHIMLGIESGDEETLRRIGKPADPGAARRAVGQIRAAGIRATGFFMVGWPWDDEALIEKTADYACSLGLDAAFLFSVTPLPGTAMWAGNPGRAVPQAVDFRTPAVNLTGMPDERYRDVFSRIGTRLDAYNRTQIRTAQGHEGASPPPANSQTTALN